ncbi:MAG: glycosyltransferase family 2 protein [bacterium]
MNNPRISFGIIVLNGEPFTKYCLRQLYPCAYEIIVVEGGSRKAVREAPDGHSTDGTLEALREFKAQEDPEDKVKIITHEGFWNEKDEQSKAYAEVATGDYLWQVDIDEFYTRKDMDRVCHLLRQNPDISGMSFRQMTFWGAPDFYCDNYFLRSFEYHRLFRWGKGFRYVTHRPPTVYDEKGRDLRKLNWWNAKKTYAMGLMLYHYSLLLPEQVRKKCSYYSTPSDITDKGYNQGIEKWMHNCYLRMGNPFRVHNMHRYLCWLCPYEGIHPEQILRLWDDIQRGEIDASIRDNADAERLIENPLYKMAVFFLNAWTRGLEIIPLHRFWSLWHRLLFKITGI